MKSFLVGASAMKKESYITVTPEPQDFEQLENLPHWVHSGQL